MFYLHLRQTAGFLCMTNLKGRGHVACLELQLQHLPGKAGGFWINILAHEARTTTNSHQLSHLYFLTDRLTLRSSCWEANGSSASQEIPRILWNPKVHDHAHNRPPPVPLLRHKIPIHALSPYCCTTRISDRGSTVVMVLCYKSKGRWFDLSWCHWIFHWHKNPSDRTMALESTQPLTEMSTRSISWG